MSIINKMMQPNMLLAAIWGRLGTCFPDSIYLRVRFRLVMGKKLNLDNPKTFNEKLNWLKVYYKNELLPSLVDKYEVKNYVAGIIGDDHIIKTYGVWDRYEDIPFEELPTQFVLKSTNGGGGNGVVLCFDKSSLNHKATRKKIKASMHTNWRILREWVYYSVKPRIIAEEMLIPSPNIMGKRMDNNGLCGLNDYKFFCFNGFVKFFKIDFGRFSDHHANYYDLNWNLLPFGEVICPPIKDMIFEQPLNFNEMVEIAEKLAQNHPFVRVDLYNINGKTFFSELTFYPDGGFSRFTDLRWDLLLGEYLELPITS